MGRLGAINQLELKGMVAWYGVVDAGWAILGHFCGLPILGWYILFNMRVLARLCYFF